MPKRVTSLIGLAAFLNALLAAPLFPPLAHASLSGDLVTLGNRHYLKGEVPEAEEAYRKALGVRREDPVAHYNLGVVLFETGDLDGALTHFERSAYANPTRPEAWSNLAIVLCAKGYLDQAESMARRALEADPAFAPAYNNLGLALEALGRPAEARKAFVRAVGLEPDLAEAQNNLGASLARAGQLETARAAFDRGILANDKLAYLYFNRGLLTLRKGDYREAVRDWERARRLDPDAAPDFVIASVALQGGDYQRAIRHFESVDPKGGSPAPPVDLDDFKPLFSPSGIDDPRLRKALGRGHADAGSASPSAAAEKQVDPKRLSKDYADLGQVSFDRGLDERAEELLADAIRLDPGNVAAREALGSVYLKKGRAEEAVMVLEPLEKDPALRADELVLIADARTAASQLPEAARLYERAARMDPKNAQARVGLGWIQVRANRRDDGIALIREGVSLAPKDSYARVTLADALQIADKPDPAEREYRRALRMNPRDARAHAHYASFLVSQSRFSEAQEHYARALEFDPDNAAVADELERLRTRKKAKIDSIWEGIVIMPILPFVGIASLLSKVSK